MATTLLRQRLDVHPLLCFPPFTRLFYFRHPRMLSFAEMLFPVCYSLALDLILYFPICINPIHQCDVINSVLYRHTQRRPHRSPPSRASAGDSKRLVSERPRAVIPRQRNGRRVLVDATRLPRARS